MPSMHQQRRLAGTTLVLRKGISALIPSDPVERWQYEVPIYTIMLIGRWSSDAFLKYIRKQVDKFTYNIAKRMLKHLKFRHLPLVD